MEIIAFHFPLFAIETKTKILIEIKLMMVPGSTGIS